MSVLFSAADRPVSTPRQLLHLGVGGRRLERCVVVRAISSFNARACGVIGETVRKLSRRLFERRRLEYGVCGA